MKLFFKHLIRSIRKRPLQPVIIIFTIAFSVLVAISSLTLKSSVTNELNCTQKSSYGHADLVLSQNSSSKSRFMFDWEIENLLGGMANAVGTYEIVLSYEGDSVFARAVDLNKVDGVFDFEFTEWGTINEEGLKSSVLITESFAKTHSVSIGDKIALDALGSRVEYTVSGISKSPFFDGCEIMLDITGIMDILAKESIFISAMDGIKPYSTVYIDVIEDDKIDDCIEILGASEKYGEKTLTEVSQSVNSGITEITVPLIINLTIILSSFLTAVVIFNCIFLLSKQRNEENMLLEVAGTRCRTLNLLQYLEVSLYWLIGAPLGALAAMPFGIGIEKLLEFKYASYEISLVVAILASIGTLIIALLTVTVFVFAKNEKIKKRTGKWLILPLLIAISVALALTFASKNNLRLSAGVVTVLLTLMLAFLVTPYLISALLSLYFKQKSKKNNHKKQIKHAWLYYSLKNLKRIDALKNTARLIASLFIVVVSVLLLTVSSHGNLNATRDMLSGDFVIANANERCYDEISLSENARSVTKIYQSRISHENGYLSLLVSASNTEAFGEHIEISELPNGNEAIISTTDAKMLGAKIGDTFKIHLEGEKISLTVKDIIETGTSMILFDCESFGIEPNMILIEAAEGKKEALLNDATLAAANELATVMSASELRNDKLESSKSVLKCADLMLIAIIIYAFIGMLNNLIDSYRQRKEELMLYRVAGAPKSIITKMVTSELVATIVFGIAVGAICTAVIILSLDKSFSVINFEIIRYLKYAF